MAVEINTGPLTIKLGMTKRPAPLDAAAWRTLDGTGAHFDLDNALVLPSLVLVAWPNCRAGCVVGVVRGRASLLRWLAAQLWSGV